jgi:hypothetical protein
MLLHGNSQQVQENRLRREQAQLLKRWKHNIEVVERMSARRELEMERYTEKMTKERQQREERAARNKSIDDERRAKRENR